MFLKPIAAKAEPTMGVLIIGSDISHVTARCTVTKPSTIGAVPCNEHTDSGAPMVQTCAPFCSHSTMAAWTTLQAPWAIFPQQTCIISLVHLLMPQFQDLALMYTVSRCEFWAAKCSNMSAFSTDLSLCCLLANQYLHTPLEKSPGHSSSESVPVDLPTRKGNPQGEGNFPFSQLSLGGADPVPILFVFWSYLVLCDLSCSFGCICCQFSVDFL